MRGGRPRYFDTKEWYSFGFRGGRVNSVRALAERFGYEGLYFLIYSPLSDLGHARGVDNDITIVDRQAQIHSPYDPTAFAFIAFWACNWQKMSIALATKAYCPTAHPDVQRTHRVVEPMLATIETEAGDTVLG